MITRHLSVDIVGFAAGLAHRAAGLVRAYFRRRKFNQLRDLDDHILDDIGVTRAEVEIATRLPFTHDAATELRRLSEDRKRRLGSPLSSEIAVDLYGRTLKPRRWL